MRVVCVEPLVVRGIHYLPGVEVEVSEASGLRLVGLGAASLAEEPARVQAPDEPAAGPAEPKPEPKAKKKPARAQAP